MMFSSEPAAARRVVVLISGSGSNLQALIDAQQTEEGLGGEICAVISDQPDAYGLERAKQAGIATLCISPKSFSSREDYDQQLIREIDQFQPDLILLAGFMRILSSAFVLRYFGRLLNIHPSLLPKYKGLHTHRRALEAGDNEHGVSIHFVTEELDGGPLIVQAKVPIDLEDDESSLARKVQVQEHLLYPLVTRWFLQGRLQLKGNQPEFDGHPLPQQGLLYQEETHSN